MKIVIKYLPIHAPKLQVWLVDGFVDCEQDESVKAFEYWSTQETVLVWVPDPQVDEQLPHADVDHVVAGQVDEDFLQLVPEHVLPLGPVLVPVMHPLLLMLEHQPHETALAQDEQLEYDEHANKYDKQV